MNEKDFEFAVNEAAIYFDNDNLVVSFGEGKSATMEIERKDQAAVVRQVLSDPNTWAAFLGSLSAALQEHT